MGSLKCDIDVATRKMTATINEQNCGTTNQCYLEEIADASGFWYYFSAKKSCVIFLQKIFHRLVKVCLICEKESFFL